MKPLVKYTGPVGWAIRAFLNIPFAVWDALKAIGYEFADEWETERGKRSADPWKHFSKWRWVGSAVKATVKSLVMAPVAFAIRVGTGVSWDQVSNR